jgi:hypothetical protein
LHDLQRAVDMEPFMEPSGRRRGEESVKTAAFPDSGDSTARPTPG